MPPEYTPFDDSELHSAQGLIYGDKPLTPKMIATLMNVDVSATSIREHGTGGDRTHGHSFLYYVMLLFVSVGVAVVIGGAFLYKNEMGPFYNSLDTARD